MAVSIVGNGGTIAEVDGTVWRSVRMTDRPVEYGAGGYYTATVTALTGAGPGANANLVSFRWTSATLIALVRSVFLQVSVTTTGTGNPYTIAAYVARSFTASDTSGTAVTLTGNNMKRRTSMAGTVLGDFRYASAGTLTAGTRTLDTQPFAICQASGFTAGNYAQYQWGIDGPGDHPIVLATNEGLVFQNLTAVTTGVYSYVMRIAWAEVPAY